MTQSQINRIGMDDDITISSNLISNDLLLLVAKLSGVVGKIDSQCLPF